MNLDNIRKNAYNDKRKEVKIVLKDRLKQLREERGLTKRELCDQTGISERAYLTYEFVEREPKISVVSKLADFYDVTTDYLLGREPAPNPFADLNLSEDDEKEVIDKYMSLPPEVRACILDVLIQLGNAAQKSQTEVLHEESQEINIIKRAARGNQSESHLTVEEELERIRMEKPEDPDM